jgi:glycosyltransferase involved in cell wall biosynthesis
MKISVVIPCLNEEDTIAECVMAARRAIKALAVEGEVVVADNGSTDRSLDLATRAGARIVPVAEKGYGSALDGGIRASTGRFVVLGDADCSYDFSEIPLFWQRLQNGDDMVIGCRMPSGGGTMERGAMPFLHRWLGNPMFSLMTRWWFRVAIHDVNCGMRGFTRELYLRIQPEASGMPFAVEMIIKASVAGAVISEVPIAFRRDGRKHNPPHLRTFRDGWHTLMMLVFSALRKKRRSPVDDAIVPGESHPEL